MHAILAVAGGFVELVTLVAVASHISLDHRASMARAALLFLPLWFIAALVYMYVGVAKAGNTVLQELPFFVLAFGVPAAVAILFRRWLART